MKFKVGEISPMKLNKPEALRYGNGLTWASAHHRYAKINNDLYDLDEAKLLYAWLGKYIAWSEGGKAE